MSHIPGAMQKAYRIQASSSPDVSVNPDIWDSGWIESEQSVGIKWGGAPLKSRQHVFWQGTLQDQSGNFSTPSQIAEFVKTINSENFKMCLDTGHCAVMKESPADAVRKYGDIIKIFHVHDNDGARDSHMYPFDGVIDWADFSEALKGLDENVVLNLETGAGRSSEKWEERQIDLNNRARKLII